VHDLGSVRASCALASASARSMEAMRAGAEKARVLAVADGLGDDRNGMAKLREASVSAAQKKAHTEYGALIRNYVLESIRRFALDNEEDHESWNELVSNYRPSSRFHASSSSAPYYLLQLGGFGGGKEDAIVDVLDGAVVKMLEYLTKEEQAQPCIDEKDECIDGILSMLTSDSVAADDESLYAKAYFHWMNNVEHGELVSALGRLTTERGKISNKKVSDALAKFVKTTSVCAEDGNVSEGAKLSGGNSALASARKLCGAFAKKLSQLAKSNADRFADDDGGKGKGKDEDEEEEDEKEEDEEKEKEGKGEKEGEKEEADEKGKGSQQDKENKENKENKAAAGSGDGSGEEMTLAEIETVAQGSGAAAEIEAAEEDEQRILNRQIDTEANKAVIAEPVETAKQPAAKQPADKAEQPAAKAPAPVAKPPPQQVIKPQPVKPQQPAPPQPIAAPVPLEPMGHTAKTIGDVKK
jgi:hypothetical protein